jgi:hypothetical protein
LWSCRASVFSHSERSIANIYENTTSPFNLIYVSSGAPEPLQRSLERESERRGFQLISTPHYLSPNQARNLALTEVRTEYIVFLDNDVLVTRGWLESLLGCAQETGAWAVGPLYMIGEFERATIHMAGGRLFVKEELGKRVLVDEQYLFDTPISEAKMRLCRRACEYVEFHCMLVRTDAFDRVGPMDEKLLNLHEERDFCLSVLHAGGGVYIEPRAVVTYVPPPPCEWWDLPYFMLRWSEAWTLASVRHFNAKWDIAGVRHVSDKANTFEEGTVIGFARVWRKRISGMRVSASQMKSWSGMALEQGKVMLAMLQSIDREYFDLALTAPDGQVVEQDLNLSPLEVLQRLPRYMQQADERDLNMMIRPIAQERADEPILLRLDDLSPRELDNVKRRAFLTLETAPDRYQCWIAVDWRRQRTSRVDQPEKYSDQTGFIRIAGSKSIDPQLRLPDGRYPRVNLVEGVAGHLITGRELDAGIRNF